MRRVLTVLAVAFAALFVTAGAASAHPLGNFTINLSSALVVEHDTLRVHYVVDMAEIPTFQERAGIDADGDGTVGPDELAAYASDRAARLVRGVRGDVDGRALRFRVASSEARLRPGQGGLEVLRIEAHLVARIPASGTLRYADGNFPGHVGWREVTAVGANGAALTGSTVPARSPSRELLRYPTGLLSDPLHVTRARVSYEPGRTGAAPNAPEPGPAAGARPQVAGGAFARLATWTGVSLPVLLLALLLAMAFGAVHALLPGHGKTIMAAYLVGAGGRLKQAVQVGVAVAFMHTASVLALGLVVLGVSSFAPERAYPWLALGSGLVVLALGAGLLVTRLRAARRAGPSRAHVHAPAPQRELVLVGVGGPPLLDVHDHDEARHHADDGGHGHPHPHELPDRERPLSRRSLAGLAVAGGILPSPTALVVLLSTVQHHRVPFGLSLIAAFSVGLAGALVAVGFVALRAREAVSRRMAGRVWRIVPVASAAVIAAVGVVLVARAVTQV